MLQSAFKRQSSKQSDTERGICRSKLWQASIQIPTTLTFRVKFQTRKWSMLDVTKELIRIVKSISWVFFSHLLHSNIYGWLYGSKSLELPNIHPLSLLLYCCMSKWGEENCECFVKLCVIFQMLMSLFSGELWECLFNFSEVNDFVFHQPIWRDCYQNWHIGNPIMNCFLPTHSKFRRFFGYFIQVFRNLLNILRTMVM